MMRDELRGDEMSAADSPSASEPRRPGMSMPWRVDARPMASAIDRKDVSAPADPACSMEIATRSRCRACRSRGAARSPSACSSSRRSPSCISCCPSSPGSSSTAHRIERGDTWWIVIGVLLEICSFAGYVVLFRAVFVRGAQSDRLARELPDHDGGTGGHAPVRGRRRGRHRAHRLGAAPLGHGAAAGGVPDGRLHGAAVRGLRGRGAARRDRAGHRSASRRRLVCDHDRAGGRRRDAVRGGRRDGAAAGRHRAASGAVGGRARVAWRTGWHAR